MRKIIYTLFLFSGFVISSLGAGGQEAQANLPAQGKETGKRENSSGGGLVFSDVINNHAEGSLVAAHYSHGSHGSHGSHRSHYSSRY